MRALLFVLLIASQAFGQNFETIRSQVNDSTKFTAGSGLGAIGFNNQAAVKKWQVLTDGTKTNLITGFANTGYIPYATSSITYRNSALYQSGGLVGIGTTTLGSNKLTVNGSIAAAGRIWTGGAYNYHTNASGGYWASGDGSFAVGMYEASGGLRFRTNTTDFLSLLSSGNFGVGLTSPARELSVYASANPDIQVVNSTTGSASSDGLVINQSGLNTYIDNQESGYLALGTADTERVRIDASGNVMIGATSPFAKLHVQGSSYTRDIITLQRSTGGAVMDALFFWDGSSPMTTSQVKGDNLVLQNEGGSDLILGTNGSQRLRINGVGAFGIGTNYGSSGQVMVSNGSGGPPSWSNSPTLNLNDNQFTIQDNSDNTKKVDFQLSGVTTGNTRTLTVPDASGTLALKGSLFSGEIAYATSNHSISSLSIMETDGNRITIDGSAGLEVKPSLGSFEYYLGANAQLNKSVAASNFNSIWSGLAVEGNSNPVSSKLSGFGVSIDWTLADNTGSAVSANAFKISNSWTTVGSASQVKFTRGVTSDVMVFDNSNNVSITNATTIGGNTTVTNGNISSGTNTNLTLTANGTGVVVLDGMTVRSGSATLDFPSVSSGSETGLTITVTGVSIGDPVFVGHPSGLGSGVFTGYCSAANTVTVKYINTGSISNDPPSATFKVVTYSF